MNRRLLALNLLLVAALIYAGIEFHARRVAAQAREMATLSRKVPPLPPPVLAPLKAPEAVMPSAYVTVAQNDLFDQSRNPNVPIDLPPPPPPLKDPPPLPFFHGMMNIGDGPIAIMSKTGSGSQEEVHAGGMIGEFKLLDFNMKEITLEWDGRVIRKRVDDAPKQEAVWSPLANYPSNGIMVMPGVASPPQPAPKFTEMGPGADNGQTYRPCQVGDSSPNGAVVDGYRKSVRVNPFGSECHWEAVGK
ncbi:MAG: hypothetical protein ABSF62_17760 [Bryobacteraceae bacterium]